MCDYSETVVVIGISNVTVTDGAQIRTNEQRDFCIYIH